MSFPSWKMGPYDTRALEAGVDIDGPTLEALAREEIDRRERERKPNQEGEKKLSADEFEPFRIVDV